MSSYEYDTCVGTTQYGNRCRTNHGLNVRGYCRDHAYQCPNYCNGYNNRREPCRATYDLNYDGYCPAHARQCRGYFVDDEDVKCLAIAKSNYNYCRAAHNPAIKYISPTRFALHNLRDDMMDTVIQFTKDRDMYRRQTLPNDMDEYELDHKLELQTWAFVFARRNYGSDEVIRTIRNCIANRAQNLTFTLSALNRLKGQIVARFHDDLLTGHRRLGYGPTFTEYLQEGRICYQGQQTRISDTTIYHIRREMAKAIQFSCRELRDYREHVYHQIANDLDKIAFDFSLTDLMQ